MHFDTSRSRVLEQRQALARARAGFAALPLSEEDDARVPEPITVALD
jgi:hypothetical protein